MKVFHLHGDNIVECERAISLIKSALRDDIIYFNGPTGSFVCPKYLFKLKNKPDEHEIVLFPGFGRWDLNILDLVKNKGGVLREAADVILTIIENDIEKPILAIEYCGALPAGNQAWQRSGRAYSFGQANILYLYVAELGGYELGENRERKAVRMPNPAVPFSYVAFSLITKSPTLPVFLTAPGADDNSRDIYAYVFAEDILNELVKNIFLGINNDSTIEELRLKALNFVETKSTSSRNGETLSPIQWRLAYKTLKEGKSLLDYLIEYAPLKWAKTAYIEGITDTAKALMNKTSAIAIGLTSSKLPMCIIPNNKRKIFLNILVQIYQDRISQSFKNWILECGNLTICWVMGFKPKGDDARPDRGLPPLTRMLVGSNENILTIVYGPASINTWERLKSNPEKLYANGLWESIFEVSNGLLIDSSTNQTNEICYLKSHWNIPTVSEFRFSKVTPLPNQIGENDVDTTIHLLLAHFANTSVFEGMCNPPGGDWSGISLQAKNRKDEYRWLTLPRVSGSGEKRPDHVFQLFLNNQKPIIICIESKETPNSVEENIGNRLTDYLKYLLKTEPSVTRSNHETRWKHANIKLDVKEFEYASVAAFISSDINKIKEVSYKANCDLLMAISYINSGEKCKMVLYVNSPIGLIIANFLVSIEVNTNFLDVIKESL